ncbi:MAG: ATP-binding cassette domain-containing protein [Bacteroidales bacterium]|nr:ATP-binding cassette domain-containing protein [Bacteroidales bacterium]
MDEILKLEGLSKTFTLSRKQQRLERTHARRKVAVDDLSLTAYRGEIFGLLGPNGAGKTTTLRMLATLIKPDKGDAWVDGCSIVTQPEDVRSKIAFLTSELKLEDFFTPNYLYDFFSELHGVEPNTAQQRKKALFDRFGISQFAEVKVADLSTGMKQKASIVISLVHDPDIIIFDEPTNGLDVVTARTVTDYLQELRSQGKTIILSTHIFSLVERLCDRVGVIIDGKLTSCGTLAEVCDGLSIEDRFFELYKAQKGDEE